MNGREAREDDRKLLMWQLIHGCLPTLSFLQSRNIGDNAICKWCGKEDEDIMHLF